MLMLTRCVVGRAVVKMMAIDGTEVECSSVGFATLQDGEAF